MFHFLCLNAFSYMMFERLHERSIVGRCCRRFGRLCIRKATCYQGSTWLKSRLCRLKGILKRGYLACLLKLWRRQVQRDDVAERKKTDASVWGRLVDFFTWVFWAITAFCEEADRFCEFENGWVFGAIISFGDCSRVVYLSGDVTSDVLFRHTFWACFFNNKEIRVYRS